MHCCFPSHSITQDNLDPVVKASLEKKLAALVEEHGQKKSAAIERKYAVKYHKVRFFERVKIERQLKKLLREKQQQQQQEGNEEGGDNNDDDEIKQLEEDLQYVLHFPKGEKYISLFKMADTAEAQTHLDSERIRLRALVKKQRVETALMTEADEGKSLQIAKRAVSNKGAGGGGGGQDLVEEEEGSEEEKEDDFFLTDASPLQDELPASSDESEEEAEEEEKEEEKREEKAKNNRRDTSAWKRQAKEDRGPKGKPNRFTNNNNTNTDTTNINKSKHAIVFRPPKPPSAKKPRVGGVKQQKSGGEKQPTRTRAEGGRKRRQRK